MGKTLVKHCQDVLDYNSLQPNYSHCLNQKNVLEIAKKLLQIKFLPIS